MLLYLDVVEGCFVGDIIEQQQGCGERDRALVPVPSRAHGSEHIAQSLWQVTAGDMRCLLRDTEHTKPVQQHFTLLVFAEPPPSTAVASRGKPLQ